MGLFGFAVKALIAKEVIDDVVDGFKEEKATNGKCDNQKDVPDYDYEEMEVKDIYGEKHIYKRSDSTLEYEDDYEEYYQQEEEEPSRETKFLKMECQNCGANLELNLDHLQAFCPYCGTKLMIDIDQLDDILIEKEKTRQKQMQYERDASIAKEREQTRRTEIRTEGIFKILKGIGKGLLIVAGLFFVFICILMGI